MLEVERLRGIRSAWDWLSHAGIELLNAFKRRPGIDRDVPHSFSFKLRRDLSSDEERMVAACGDRCCRADPAHPDDVFCLVKTFMADAQLQQSPVLVLPASRSQRVPATPRTVTRRPISEDRARGLVVLARTLEKPAYGLARAASYLRQLAANHPVQLEDLPALSWLAARAAPQPLVDRQALPLAVLPQTPWNLQVRFKHLNCQV